MDHREAYFIEVGRTLAPRGYNVRNTNDSKRHHKRSTARDKREARAADSPSAPGPDDRPPPPPLSPHEQMHVDQDGASMDPSWGDPTGGQPVSPLPMPNSSYARRAYTHMTQLRLLRNATTWDDMLHKPKALLMMENPMLMHLEPFHMSTLRKLLGVLTGFSLTELDQCKPAGATDA